MTWGAVAGLVSVLPRALLGVVVRVEAHGVPGLTRPRGALAGTERVVYKRALPRVARRDGASREIAGLVVALEVQQRPRVLGQQVGVVEVVVKLQHVELVVVLLHLSRERLDGEEHLAMHLPRRPLRTRQPVARLVNFSRVTEVKHRARERPFGLAQHAPEHVVADERVGVVTEDLVGLRARREQPVLVVEPQRFELERSAGDRRVAGLLRAHGRGARERQREREREPERSCASSELSLHRFRVARARRSMGLAMHSRITDSTLSVPGASSRR